MATIDAMLERDERKRRESVERALKHGGLPTEAEILEVETALGEAYNKLEMIASRFDGMTNAMHEELPSPITLEHVGIAAGFACMLDIEIAQLRQTADDVQAAIGELDMMRREQQGGAA